MNLREMLVGVGLLTPLLFTDVLAQEVHQDPAEPADVGDVGALYPAEGAGVTYDYCATCHSEMLVAQQGQTREGWDKLLEWMVAEQGMEPIPEEDRETVLDYLSDHYGPDRPHFPR